MLKIFIQIFIQIFTFNCDKLQVVRFPTKLKSNAASPQDNEIAVDTIV